MLKKFLSGVSAGILISVGGSVFLACDSRYVGAVLFSVALLSICFKGYSLFTGKVGFIPEKHDGEALSVLFLGLLGNTVGVFFCGLCLSFALPAYRETAKGLCAAKLKLPMLSVLIRGIFCGILMYLAVSIYRDRKSTLGILFCIPVFILCGFEHSIADMFYFAAAGTVTGRMIAFILTVIAGNSIGGMLLPCLNGGFRTAEKGQDNG